ncbi:MAG: cellulose binding domain-containing protein [Kineosporiaceae bacterium]
MPAQQVVAQGASCKASLRVASSWATGYQAEVTVTAGSSPANWSVAPGGTITQVWGGANTSAGKASGSVSANSAGRRPGRERWTAPPPRYPCN